MQNNYLWLGVGVVIAILIVGGILFVHPHAAVAPTQTATTTQVSLGGGVTATLPAGATIHEVPTVEAPNLNLQVSYSAGLPADAVSILKLDIASTTAYLKTHPQDGNEWLQLALYYKTAGDYQAAADVWTYMTEVAPTSYIAFGDLGDLYQNFLPDYSKAEANYKAAIAIDPNIPDYYAGLYYLYRYDENNPAAAQAIVAEGLKANPGNNTLLSLQNQP